MGGVENMTKEEREKKKTAVWGKEKEKSSIISRNLL